MTIEAGPTKQQKRELARWAQIKKLHEAGLSIAELSTKYDVTPAQIYALLARAKEAREKGWI